LLATLWPWSLIASVLCGAGIVLLGYFFNEFVLSLARFPLCAGYLGHPFRKLAICTSLIFLC